MLIYVGVPYYNMYSPGVFNFNFHDHLSLIGVFCSLACTSKETSKEEYDGVFVVSVMMLKYTNKSANL